MSNYGRVMLRPMPWYSFLYRSPDALLSGDSDCVCQGCSLLGYSNRDALLQGVFPLAASLDAPYLSVALPGHQQG